MFSYQVAAGKTISEYNGVAVILKSSDTNKSSFPSVSSRHLTLVYHSLASRKPNKCFIKYSCPLAELEIKLDLHTNNVLGWFFLNLDLLSQIVYLYFN